MIAYSKQYESLFQLVKALTQKTITSISQIQQLQFLKLLLNSIDNKPFKLFKNDIEIQLSWNHSSSLKQTIQFIQAYYLDKMNTDISSWVNSINNIYKQPIQLWKIILGIGLKGPNHSQFINLILQMNPDKYLQDITQQTIQKLQQIERQNQLKQKQKNNKNHLQIPNKNKQRKQSADIRQIAQLVQVIETLKYKKENIQKQFEIYKKQSTYHRKQLQDQLKKLRYEKLAFDQEVSYSGLYRGAVNASPAQILRDIFQQMEKLSKQLNRQKQKVQLILQQNKELNVFLNDLSKINDQYQITKQNQIQLKNILDKVSKQLQQSFLRQKNLTIRVRQLENENYNLSQNLKSQFQSRRTVNLHRLDGGIDVQTKLVGKKKLGDMGKQKSTTVLKHDYKDPKKQFQLNVPFKEQPNQKSIILEPQTMKNLIHQINYPQQNQQLDKLKQENLILSNQIRVLKIQNKHLIQLNSQYEQIINTYKINNMQLLKKYEEQYNQILKIVGRQNNLEKFNNNFQEFLQSNEFNQNLFIKDYLQQYHNKQQNYRQKISNLQRKIQKTKNKYIQLKKKKRIKKSKKPENQNFPLQGSFIRFNRDSYNPNHEIQRNSIRQEPLQEQQFNLNFNKISNRSQLQVVPQQMTQRSNVDHIETISENFFENIYKQSIDSEGNFRNSIDNRDRVFSNNFEDYQQLENVDNNINSRQLKLNQQCPQYQQVNLEQIEENANENDSENQIIKKSQISNQYNYFQSKIYHENSSGSQNQYNNLNNENSNQMHQPQTSKQPKNKVQFKGTSITQNDQSAQNNQNKVEENEEDKHQEFQIPQLKTKISLEVNPPKYPQFNKRLSQQNYRQSKQSPYSSSLLDLPGLRKNNSLSKNNRGEIQQLIVDDDDIRSRARSIINHSRFYQMASQIYLGQNNQYEDQQQQYQTSQSSEQNENYNVKRKLNFDTQILNKEVLQDKQKFQQMFKYYSQKMSQNANSKIITIQKSLESVTQNHMSINQVFNKLFRDFIEQARKNQQLFKQSQRQRILQQKQLTGDASQVMQLLKSITEQKNLILKQLQALRRIKQDRDTQQGKVKQLIEFIEKLKGQLQNYKKFKTQIDLKNHQQQQKFIQKKQRMSIIGNHFGTIQAFPFIKKEKVSFQIQTQLMNNDQNNTIQHQIQIKQNSNEKKIQKVQQIVKKQNKKLIFQSNSYHFTANPQKVIKKQQQKQLIPVKQTKKTLSVCSNNQSILIQPTKINSVQQKPQVINQKCKTCEINDQLIFMNKLQINVLNQSIKQVQQKNKFLNQQIEIITSAIGQLRQMAKCRSFFKEIK